MPGIRPLIEVLLHRTLVLLFATQHCVKALLNVTHCNTLYLSNQAASKYILGSGIIIFLPAIDINMVFPLKILWLANYHPDGGKLFYPLAYKTYLVPVALAGDKVLSTLYVLYTRAIWVYIFIQTFGTKVFLL